MATTRSHTPIKQVVAYAGVGDDVHEDEDDFMARRQAAMNDIVARRMERRTTGSFTRPSTSGSGSGIPVGPFGSMGGGDSLRPRTVSSSGMSRPGTATSVNMQRPTTSGSGRVGFVEVPRAGIFAVVNPPPAMGVPV